MTGIIEINNSDLQMTEISLQDGNCPYDKNEINKQIKMWPLFCE